MKPVRILFRARLSSAWITLAAISAVDKIRRGYLRKVAVTYGWRTSFLLNVLLPLSLSPSVSLSLFSLNSLSPFVVLDLSSLASLPANSC